LPKTLSGAGRLPLTLGDADPVAANLLFGGA
jgi:hypothetical protein